MDIDGDTSLNLDHPDIKNNPPRRNVSHSTPLQKVRLRLLEASEFPRTAIRFGVIHPIKFVMRLKYLSPPSAMMSQFTFDHQSKIFEFDNSWKIRQQIPIVYVNKYNRKCFVTDNSRIAGWYWSDVAYGLFTVRADTWQKNFCDSPNWENISP